MYKILIAEDDAVIAKTMKSSIEAWGYEVYIVTDFSNVTARFAQLEPHLVLMDISLPFYNGFHWCSQIRKVSKVPVIFISSASDNMNIVMAINMGGDDFISKPFDMNVLVAKVQAMIRRTYDFSGSMSVIEHRGAILDLNDATLSYNERVIELTKNEFRILRVLVENKGSIISRDTLMQELWSTDSFIDENTLTVNVNRLRKKLDTAGLENYITTKKGIGYIVEQ